MMPATMTRTGTPAPEQAGTETFDDSTYYMCAEAMIWDDAFASCAASGIHLVSIESQAENDFLEVVADHGFNHWWIGLNDLASEGSWVWDDGTPIGFTAWDPGHPTTDTSENCGHYDGTSTDIGEWNQGPCTWSAYYYICEDD